MMSKNAERFDMTEPVSGVREVVQIDDPFASLLATCEKQVDALVAPSGEKLIRIRALLDAFEVNLRARARQQVTAKVYAALGSPPPAMPDALDDVEDQLFEELDSLTPDWAKPEPPPIAISVPAPVPPQVTIPAPPATLISVPKARVMADPSDEELARAKALIEEIEKTDYAAGHPLRTAPLMQAHVAEVRILLGKIPERHPTGWQLTQMISKLARAKAEANIQPFIRGLARNHRPADWHRVSLEARKQVARFDVDAEAAESVPVAKKPKKETPKEDSRPSLFNWPALVGLRERLKGGPLILAGGVPVPNKLASIQTRFGIAAEWHEIEDSAPRAVGSLIDKIRKGRVGAVVLLTGLLGHDAWKSIMEACKATGVPCAMGDRGGLGDIQMALDGLEKSLS